MLAVELFGGIGGLALGLSRAKFRHLAVVEWNARACETMRANKAAGVAHVRDWPIIESDVREFPYQTIKGDLSVLSGGVPCQPFSLGGKHLGHLDERNMFPTFLDAVRNLRPQTILIENVKGLLRESFSRYFNYVLLQLRHPECIRKISEDWADHLARLEEIETSGVRSGLHYNVVHQLMNAADFGVPQKRERVFIVGIRTDLKLDWSFPLPTHSKQALDYEQYITGEYWERHSLQRPSVGSLAVPLVVPEHFPWVTVRDAVEDLPEFGTTEARAMSHEFWPGAKPYAGHTGSILDQPAKALKVGDHGVPGGENMLVLDDGSVRYMSVREAARLQTFPDEFIFPGTWTHGLQQLGNAVPVELGEYVARSLAAVLEQPLAQSRQSA